MIIARTIEQIVDDNLFQSPDKKPVIIIYGPRQVGKTTLVQSILRKYKEKSVYYNCDFLDVQETFAYKNAHYLEKILKGLKLLILDEAQRIENIGLVLKILVDTFPDVQVIATGSSSFELSNKINEPLTGRKMVFRLFPFSYEELFDYADILKNTRQLPILLRFGSYPALLEKNEQEMETILKEITSSYLFKDIFTFQQLKKPELLYKLLRLLAFQIGSEVSFHELAVQLAVDQVVIQKYIHLLEEAFVIFRLGAFKRNLRTEVVKSRKIYFWDLGIRNILIQNINSLEFRNDIGQLWENFCIAERFKWLNNHQKNINSYFWRTYDQKEIDYIEEKEDKLWGFEFKWKEKKSKKVLSYFPYVLEKFSVITSDNFDPFIKSNF